MHKDGLKVLGFPLWWKLIHHDGDGLRLCRSWDGGRVDG